MTDTALMTASEVYAGYGKQAVLHRISLSIRAGECVSLVGPNGSGKSTLLKTLIGLVPAQQGGIALWGQGLSALSSQQIARKLAFVAQGAQVPAGFTVEELVSQGRFPHRGAYFLMRPSRHREVVERALAQTALRPLRHRPVTQLSGGERQRVWLAMAIAQEPEVLLLDEPMTYLDITHQLDILELVSQLNRDKGVTVFMALHDLNLAARFSHRVIVLSQGTIAAQGPPEQVLTPELCAEVFGVRMTFARVPGISAPILYPLHTKLQTKHTKPHPNRRYSV